MAEDKSKQATDELDPKEFCNRRILPACGIYLTSNIVLKVTGTGHLTRQKDKFYHLKSGSNFCRKFRAEVKPYNKKSTRN